MPESLTDKLDKIVLNKFLALPIFLLAIGLMYFLSVGVVGSITSDFIDALFNGSTSISIFFHEVPFEIEGIESSNNEIIEKELLPIKEIIEIPKGKKSSEITKLQQNILDLVNREKCSNSNKIILDILCPTDNKTIGQKDIYLTFLFDLYF